MNIILRRFLSNIIDSIISITILIITVLLTGYSITFNFSMEALKAKSPDYEMNMGFILFFGLIMITICIIINLLCWLLIKIKPLFRKNQSLGMNILKIKLVSINEEYYFFKLILYELIKDLSKIFIIGLLYFLIMFYRSSNNTIFEKIFNFEYQIIE